ncbi:hypothetical protein L6452_03699 [Arctium lappa]|uniref:Uncharacterized protein n=1 Tax=Arctium lappa TaxID=4217 RepID=A0ACB9FNJ2_ARCLA|nr:hypothetical protein L6452_03699 [Arctium lappa]
MTLTPKKPSESTPSTIEFLDMLFDDTTSYAATEHFSPSPKDMLSDTNQQHHFLRHQFQRLQGEFDRFLGTNGHRVTLHEQGSIRDQDLSISLDATNKSLDELLGLIKEKNTEILRVISDFFKCMEAMQQDILSLRDPLSDALDQANTQDQVNTQILDVISKINAKLDDMSASVARYYAETLDIDISDSAFMFVEKNLQTILFNKEGTEAEEEKDHLASAEIEGTNTVIAIDSAEGKV